jgi:nuclear pore complex protein Nup210
MIGKDHPVPAIAKSELSIVCDLPSAITLIANENGTIMLFLLIFQYDS